MVGYKDRVMVIIIPNIDEFCYGNIFDYKIRKVLNSTKKSRSVHKNKSSATKRLQKNISITTIKRLQKNPPVITVKKIHKNKSNITKRLQKNTSIITVKKPIIDYKYLFILGCNGSGTSLLYEIIRTSPNVVSMGPMNEGHSNAPKNYPSNHQYIVWANNTNFINELRNYNWDNVKCFWNKIYLRQQIEKPNANIRLEKSPPHLLVATFIQGTFENSHFIILVRDPYANCMQLYYRWLRHKSVVSMKSIAEHVTKVFNTQFYNANNLKNKIIIKYEDLCLNTKKIEQRLLSFLPLKSIDVTKKFYARFKPSQYIHDANKKYYPLLTEEYVDIINNSLVNEEKIINGFGYQIKPYIYFQNMQRV